MTPGNPGGKEGGDSFLPKGLCAAFGPVGLGRASGYILHGLQGPAGSAMNINVIGLDKTQRGLRKNMVASA